MSETETLPIDDIHALALAALQRSGFSPEQALAIADTVTVAERDGCVSHGLFRIPFYIKAATQGSADAQAVPVLRDSDSSVVHVEGGHGFCPLALKLGEPALVEKARKHGIAALAIHQVYNIAALWPEVERLASAGFVAFAFTGSSAYVAPAGGTQPLYGTNPMAFGFPRSQSPPLVFDQASSASARGEIQLHLRDGKSLPEGWAIDSNGEPTTDPTAALAGAQLPFGGYKGAALALMVELLAGALIGDMFSFESSAHDVNKVGAPHGGEWIMAVDPSHCGKGDHLARAEQLFAAVLEQPGTRLPSDRRYQARTVNLQQGVPVNKVLLDELRSIGGAS